MSRKNSHFSTWRERVAHTRILVAGDAMLDRYWFGDVERISPEAPVPIVRIARTEERPGGAANVARNAAVLGARTRRPKPWPGSSRRMACKRCSTAS